METRRKYYRRKRKRPGRKLFLAGILLFSAALLAFRGWRKPEGVRAPEPTVVAAREELVSGTPAETLPERFDLREHLSISRVPDQGGFGTCWAFASLLALETSMPENLRTGLSADHMSLRNSFGLGQEDGGDYAMAMAYLLSWQGPVSEAEDPYGDGVSPEGLSPVCHVQEIRILPEKDYERIKQAVYTTGGVQSSLYFPMEQGRERELCYRDDTCAMYYDGENGPNHDAVILGWDDGFPRENFSSMPEEDGAFLCMNSWGSSFGEDGCFWVSYEDVNIGTYNVLYSGIEPPDNYGTIYQADLCGWTGQLGYGNRTAWFANVYEAAGEEVLCAAGLYAVEAGVSCRIYAAANVPVQETGGVSQAFSERRLVFEGTFAEAGFYTVPFEEAVQVSAGERFAVLAEVTAQETKQPVAIEYAAGSRTENIDITDGEGYISPDGRLWERAEEKEGCNLCLKVYSEDEYGEQNRICNVE